jgi:UDP-GlcNAc:undecaprenyl-phosphate GlcNAc-1-phosphate transferase
MFLVMAAALLGPFLTSTVATWVVRGWARGRGFVDHPGGHKAHARPLTLGGGIAITLSLCVPLVAVTLAARFFRGTQWSPELLTTHGEGIAGKLPEVLAIVAGALVLHVLGLIDDHKALRPRPKFAVQFAVAIGIAGPAGIRAGEALGPVASMVLTVLWIVLVTNAFNFLDNMDGLSAGVAAIAAVIFAAAAFRAGQIFVPGMALVLAGVLTGFLVFNFSPASIIMGDAGSMVVGYFMAVLTILVTYYDPDHATRPGGLFMPLVVLAVPLYDVTSVTWLRLRAGQSPFRGDRRHFSHRLVNRGMSPRAAVLTIYLATAATGLSAILLPSADHLTAGLILAQTICVVLIIAVLEHPSQKDNSQA